MNPVESSALLGKRCREKDATSDAEEGEGSGSDAPNADGGISGSFSMEEVVISADYLRRVTFDNAPKKRYALALAYLGTNYRGLQVNPGIVTIESVLERALLLAGGIESQNFGNLHKIGWTRSGRTDKGVHAVANCCSMKLCVPPGGEAAFIDSANSFLPPDIRLLGMTKTTKHFNAKIFCSSRRYEYLLPTYMLAPADFIEGILRDILLAPERSASEMVDGRPAYLPEEDLRTVRDRIKGFRVSQESLGNFRSALDKYKGTEKYHNFTSDKTSKDGSATRYMISVECTDPIIFNGSEVEWVCVHIHGQSFLLNQVLVDDPFLLYIV
jgi:tRNA pseudouridine38-40 synthase